MSLLDALVRLAAGLAALLVLAELVSRIYLRRRGQYFVWAPGTRIRMELDREALPSLEPVVRFEVNEAGERGRALPRSWSDTYRVLVAGGSVAECWLLDQESSWPAVIQRELEKPESLARLRASRAHVGSIGRSLVACQHIDLMLERTLPRYGRLDVVVFMTGASDLVHWFEKRAPPSIEEDEVPLETIFAWHPEGPFGWTPRTLALRRLASRWRLALVRPVERRENVGKNLAEARRMRARALEVLREVPDPAPMLDRYEKYLRAMIERARSKAGRVIVARQPWLEKEFTPQERERLWMFGAGRIHAEEVAAYYDYPLVWSLMRQVDARASAVARELGVEQIDLWPLLEPSFDVWYDEMHTTPKGCEIVGRAIARAIVEVA